MHSKGHFLVTGRANGQVLYSDVPISIYGGIDVRTGEVIDRHHPLHGQNVRNRILAIPAARGSCTGSGGILELLLNGCGPAALIFAQLEPIITLGVWIAQAMFQKSIPIILLNLVDFKKLQDQCDAVITMDSLIIADSPSPIMLSDLPALSGDNFILSPRDQNMLEGKVSEAARLAMQITIMFAKMQGAESLLDVSQAHIDACIYVGPSSVQFPEKLLRMGAKCVIPATMNATSVDRRRWRELGCDPKTSLEAQKVGDAYLKMGVGISFTCAPYLLTTAPSQGDQIGWAESNAVVFANSVLGSRTQKYPDFLDVFIAITGRAPNAGCHTDKGREPTVSVEVADLQDFDESFYPLLGYCIGELSTSGIPLIIGLERNAPSTADLKAFGAALATTSSAPMFHMRGVTPEAAKFEEFRTRLKRLVITREDLQMSWKRLNTHTDCSVGAVTLGNPHFALEEYEIAAHLSQGRKRHPGTEIIITSSREVYEAAVRADYVTNLEEFGATFITDTCWCMIEEPIIPRKARNLMTNSANYAHYGPGTTKRGFHFGSLARCIDVAEAGTCDGSMPAWLCPSIPPASSAR